MRLPRWAWRACMQARRYPGGRTGCGSSVPGVPTFAARASDRHISVCATGIGVSHAGTDRERVSLLRLPAAGLLQAVSRAGVAEGRTAACTARETRDVAYGPGPTRRGPPERPPIRQSRKLHGGCELRQPGHGAPKRRRGTDSPVSRPGASARRDRAQHHCADRLDVATGALPGCNWHRPWLPWFEPPTPLAAAASPTCIASAPRPLPRSPRRSLSTGQPASSCALYRLRTLLQLDDQSRCSAAQIGAIRCRPCRACFAKKPRSITGMLGVSVIPTSATPTIGALVRSASTGRCKVRPCVAPVPSQTASTWR